MSIIAREKKPKGGGQSPQFKMRIDPALKEQLDAVAAEEGVKRKALNRKADFLDKFIWIKMIELAEDHRSNIIVVSSCFYLIL